MNSRHPHKRHTRNLTTSTLSAYFLLVVVATKKLKTPGPRPLLAPYVSACWRAREGVHCPLYNTKSPERERAIYYPGLTVGKRRGSYVIRIPDLGRRVAFSVRVFAGWSYPLARGCGVLERAIGHYKAHETTPPTQTRENSAANLAPVLPTQVRA